jgi:ankyrin repeat protein
MIGGHVLPIHHDSQGPVPCDKIYVRGVMEAMLEHKISFLQSTGQLEHARWFAALQPVLLRNLPQPEGASAEEEPASPTSRLKELLQWRGDKEEASFVAQSGLSLLLYATVSNDLLAVKDLLRTNAADVHTAAQEGFEPFGFPPGLTPLHFAVSFADWEVVELLLEAGADPMRCDVGWEMDPLHHAALRGRDGIVSAWLQRFGSSWEINRQNKYGLTPLHFSVKYGGPSLASVKALLAAGADQSIPDAFGSLPLHEALICDEADPEIVRALLAADGAVDINVQSVSPTYFMSGLMSMMRFATNWMGSGNKLVHMFASYNGLTALHHAAGRGDVQLCGSLLDAGADPTLRNGMGHTPLQYARWKLNGGNTDGKAPAALEALLGALESGQGGEGGEGDSAAGLEGGARYRCC